MYLGKPETTPHPTPDSLSGIGQKSWIEQKEGKGRRQRGGKATRVRQALPSRLAVWEMGLINRKALRLRGMGLRHSRLRKERNESTRPNKSSQSPLNPRVPLWDPYSHTAMLCTGSPTGTAGESQALKQSVSTYLLSVHHMAGTIPSTGDGYISEDTDKNSYPHEAFIPVQAQTLNSIVKYVLDRDVCYPKNTGGKANVRGAKKGLPEEKTSEGGKGVSRGDI